MTTPTCSGQHVRRCAPIQSLVGIRETRTQDLSIYCRLKALPLDYLSYAYILFIAMINILSLSKAGTFDMVLVYLF